MSRLSRRDFIKASGAMLGASTLGLLKGDVPNFISAVDGGKLNEWNASWPEYISHSFLKLQTALSVSGDASNKENDIQSREALTTSWIFMHSLEFLLSGRPATLDVLKKWFVGECDSLDLTKWDFSEHLTEAVDNALPDIFCANLLNDDQNTWLHLDNFSDTVYWRHHKCNVYWGTKKEAIKSTITTVSKKEANEFPFWFGSLTSVVSDEFAMIFGKKTGWKLEMSPDTLDKIESNSGIVVGDSDVALSIPAECVTRITLRSKFGSDLEPFNGLPFSFVNLAPKMIELINSLKIVGIDSLPGMSSLKEALNHWNNTGDAIPLATLFHSLKLAKLTIADLGRPLEKRGETWFIGSEQFCLSKKVMDILEKNKIAKSLTLNASFVPRISLYAQGGYVTEDGKHFTIDTKMGYYIDDEHNPGTIFEEHLT